MDNTEAFLREVLVAQRRAEDDRARVDARIGELAGTVEALLDLLIARGALVEGHRKHLRKLVESSARERPPRVHLRLVEDKYAITAPQMDCAPLLPICRARCCTFTFDLSVQDLDEGVVRWDVNDPYRIRHERDGYCTHLDRETRGCRIHDQRPATCRHFACIDDARVWADFARRIPAEGWAEFDRAQAEIAASEGQGSGGETPPR